MSFLPIVERELRVASRKRSTFRVRVFSAMVALFLGGGFLLLSRLGMFGGGGSTLGRGLFTTLTFLSLAGALLAGLFFTSDSLSGEKRDGTLGLLFLTNLRGHDVILGKLLATSLRGFFALLAIFPVISVTLIMGGVTGMQFWRTTLALVNALFISLTSGLLVSALSRDAQKAIAATLFLLVIVIAAGPAVDASLAAIQRRPYIPVLSLSSPGYIFRTASAWGRSPFWLGLFANQAVGWTFLGLACMLVPRTWQDKASSSSVARSKWTSFWRFGGAKYRSAMRRRLLEPNPVLWLACRERWQALSLWGMSFLWAGSFVAIFSSIDATVAWMVWSSMGGVLVLVLYLGVASQASRFFVEAQRSGLMELLLATPLTSWQIVRGQWHALLRMFSVPLALILATQLLGAFLVQQRTWSNAAFSTPALATGTPVTSMNTNAVPAPGPSTRASVMISTRGFAAPGYLSMFAVALAGTLTVIANLAALSWFGMWSGLSSKSSNLATLRTLVFVQLIPWFIIGFVSAISVPLLFLSGFVKTGLGASSQVFEWFPLIIATLSTVLHLSKDIAFILWSRRKLLAQIRERAVVDGSTKRPPLPLRSPGAPPPLISSS